MLYSEDEGIHWTKIHWNPPVRIVCLILCWWVKLSRWLSCQSENVDAVDKVWRRCIGPRVMDSLKKGVRLKTRFPIFDFYDRLFCKIMVCSLEKHFLREHWRNFEAGEGNPLLGYGIVRHSDWLWASRTRGFDVYIPYTWESVSSVFTSIFSIPEWRPTSSQAKCNPQPHHLEVCLLYRDGDRFSDRSHYFASPYLDARENERSNCITE